MKIDKIEKDGKIMKKITSIVLAFIIALSMGVTVAFAATTNASITANSNVKAANKGDTINVTVDLSANSNLGTLTLNLLYNTSEYEYVAGSLKANGLFSMEETNDKTAGRLRFVAIIGSSVNNAGTLFSAQFKVLKPNSTISLDVEEAYNGSDEDVTASLAARVTNFTVACAHGKTEEKVTKQPTCTAAGTKETVCKECGKTIKTETISATGHTFGAWKVTTPATCTKAGVETRECSCGEKETRAIPVNAHTPGDWTVKTPETCEKAGVEVRKCKDCGTEIESRSIPAAGHKFGAWKVTTAPTCTEKGVETRTCSVCNATETREVPANGHTPGAWTVITEPTCTETGLKKAICKDCGQEYTEVIPALGHKADKWEIVKEATCTEDGEKKAVCTVCGDEFTEVIPATGHKFGEWKVVKEATATEKGLKERVCEVCGFKETIEIPVIGTIEEPTKAPNVDNSTKSPVTGDSRENNSAVLIALFSALGLCTVVAATTYGIKKKKVK